MKQRYVIAFYELSRAYGGPEEGGWYYDEGTIIHAFAIANSEERAREITRKANAWLYKLHKAKRRQWATRYTARYYENTADSYFPKTRPHYE